MIKLQKSQIDAVKAMIQFARGANLSVDIKINRPDIIGKCIDISTSSDDYEIDEILNGDYLEAPHFDINNYKPIRSIFEWNRCYHADYNGWVCLFNDTNHAEDCRWFMKIDDINTITLYRKESEIIKVITFIRSGDQVKVVPPYDDKDDFVLMYGGDSINDNDGFVRYLNTTILKYSGLVIDVLNSVITNIEKASTN